MTSGLGHANRCLETEFVVSFDALRKRLLGEGLSGDALRGRLDEFLLGRLRIAAKGRRRDGDRLVAVTAEDQLRDGMFMAGEAAIHIGARGSVAELHERLTVQAAARLAAVGAPEHRQRPSRPRDIAVIGMALALPGAGDPDRYWANLLAKKSAIGEIPAEAWDWRLFFDPAAKTGDKISSRWGGFFEPIEFDPLRYGIPPASIPHTVDRAAHHAGIVAAGAG